MPELLFKIHVLSRLTPYQQIDVVRHTVVNLVFFFKKKKVYSKIDFQRVQIGDIGLLNRNELNNFIRLKQKFWRTNYVTRGRIFPTIALLLLRLFGMHGVHVKIGSCYVTYERIRTLVF